MYDMYQTIGGLNFRILGKSFILGGWGFLLRILGGGVQPSSPNPDPISDQKM